MSDAALANAKVRREALINKISKLNQQIDQIKSELQAAKNELEAVEAFIRAWHDFAGLELPATQTPEAHVPVTSLRNAPSRYRRKPTNPKKEFVVDKAIEIIRENGKPMSRHDLFVALRNHGVALYGKNPEMVLSTMLWRMQDKIVRLRPYGYWPAEDPYKPAGYMPNSEHTDDSSPEDHSPSRSST